MVLFTFPIPLKRNTPAIILNIPYNPSVRQNPKKNGKTMAKNMVGSISLYCGGEYILVINSNGFAKPGFSRSTGIFSSPSGLVTSTMECPFVDFLITSNAWSKSFSRTHASNMCVLSVLAKDEKISSLSLSISTCSFRIKISSSHFFDKSLASVIKSFFSFSKLSS